MKTISFFAMMVAALQIIGWHADAVAATSNDTFKAKELYMACNPPAGMDKDVRSYADQTCEAYIRGLTDGLFMMKTFSAAGKGGCLPPEGPISNAEARSEFSQFLMAHPEASENSAGLIASAAIIAAHPCRSSN